MKKANWKKALGIKYKRGMTNAALAPRDYSVRCNTTETIAIYEGYHIWWCATHHQPLAWCEKSVLEEGYSRLTGKIEKAHSELVASGRIIV